MKSYIIIISSITLLFLIGCSSSYQKLSNNEHVPKDNFSKYLMKNYKNNADFEANEMHDWNSAKLYSEKALKALKGVKIKPEKINTWNIPKEKVKELNIAYENLMLVYPNALNLDPYNLALAISSLDCWAEQQEENWQTWDINECKSNFLEAMHNIYNNLEKDKNKLNKKDSTKNETKISVVTKSNNEEILQIIYFDFDKSNLSQVSINSIKKFIKKNENKISKYLVVGHTDTKGSKEYNSKLSLERAKSVKKILINIGINSKHISILGLGESSPIIFTEDEVKHPANRRAEIKPLN